MYEFYSFGFVLMAILTNGVDHLYMYILSLLTDVDENPYINPCGTSIRIYSYEFRGSW
jgi:hypothetical protein